MKKRIAGLEGESRTSKGLRISLEKHVKILEMALKREREKIKSLSKGEIVDLQKDAREQAREELKAVGKGELHPTNLWTISNVFQNFSQRASVNSKQISM